MDQVTWLLFIGALAGAHAFQSFTPKCPLPDDGVNFVSGPNTRGTLDMVWSSFSVLILCTWTVQHLSVPSHKENKVHTWGKGFRKKAGQFLTKLKWMLVTLVGPEYMVAKALTEFVAARYSRAQFKNPKWTTTHGHFANMRGFVLRFRVAAVRTSLEPKEPSTLGQSLFKLRERGEPPYYEQDEERARAIELTHCEEICGKPCGYRTRNDDDARSAFRSRDLSSAPPLQSEERGQPGLIHASTQPQDNTRQSRSTAHLTNGSPQIRRASTMPQSTSPRLGAKPATPSAHQQPGTNVVDTSHAQHSLPREGDSIAEALTKERESQEEKQPELGPHPVWEGTWPLNSDQMHYAYEVGLIADSPVSVEILSDRSKGDALVRVAAMLQITWLLVQIIARSFSDMDTTLLEVTVIAFALCALATYALLWHKPQDVTVPVYVEAARLLTRADVIGLAARSPVSSLMGHEFWLHGVAVRAMADNVWPHSPGLRVRVPGLMREPFYFNPIVIGIGLGGAFFGSIHFAAWNFVDIFPTDVERLLWRLACIVLVGLPPIGISIYWVGTHYRKTHEMVAPRVTRVLKPFGYALMPLYLLARLYIVVEVFRSLPYLPPSAYREVDWPIDIPHAS